MALITTRRYSELSSSFVFAPERYDPRRTSRSGGEVSLGQIASLRRELVRPGMTGAFFVIDTGDAREGVIVTRHASTSVLQSAKRVIVPGDVIVSRLRPYLRQIAYVDEAIQGVGQSRPVVSSEFQVLRPREGESIAFLVPFLLTDSVQAILAASQEGGHHPRFRPEVLLSLPLSAALLAAREELSEQVLQSIRKFRMYEGSAREVRERAQALFGEIGTPLQERRGGCEEEGAS